MPHRKAFTLVELLVVIAIIAILLTIAMPALIAAKETASLANCLANLKILSMAWRDYAGDHGDFIVRGYATPPTWDPKGWVLRPVPAAGAPPITEEDQKVAVREGAMYPYTHNVKAYHCPGDKRTSNQAYPVLVSYSITAGLYGQTFPGVCLPLSRLHRKLNAVKFPEEKIVFMEEAAPSVFNAGSWCVHTSDCPGGDWPGGQGDSDWFVDRGANFHSGKGNTGWADGHAETRKWVDERTVRYFGDIDTGGAGLESADNLDLKWLQNHFPYVR